MIKMLLATIFALTVTSNSAHAANVVTLKDFRIEQQNSSTVHVHYQNAVVKIEKVDGQRFKVNNQVVVLSKDQTMDQLEKQLQMAYKKSNAKSAALEELFISKAHAITPLFAAVAAGLFGFAMGDAVCKQKNPKPAPAETTEYVTPETVK